ncbi:DUF2300 domain-containing protein [Azoarcus olearius]|uniref:Conserved hypothetical secreted protein n=1 Tax=Azoarcus sp. (strain BH72) TaxID=418699 RepID=A1K1G2_AZOSB|nr:DUF2300 domain-containing protein [Azoarcus olearius]CAL92667.1 conserved hypothetical secreted protein [Azoarcus olearius]
MFPHLSSAFRLRLLVALACALLIRPAAAALDLAYRDPASGELVLQRVDGEGRPLAGVQPPAAVPLGSVWKLFVFAWLVEHGVPAPDYACRAGRGSDAASRRLREEESYCCESGGSIGRDAALVASCGLFFEPARLGIDAADWRAFWTARAPALPWLADLGALVPDTAVSPAALIGALEAVPPRARAEAASVLLARAFAPGGEAGAVGTLGGRLRVKTFSWYLPGTRTRYGGGAGWLADGTPLWFGGAGTGQQVLVRDAAALAAALPAGVGSLAPGCVDVAFFSRYPLRRVDGADGRPARAGALRGRHVAVFANGVSLPFRASGQMRLDLADGAPRVYGRFGVDEYVARVLDREADAGETEAARALAVVARSYLFNEARRAGNCLAIADSSRTQRVSPNPPSVAALAVAGFTTELVLRGAPVGYHLDTPGPDRLVWREAVAEARAGARWDAMLRRAFPAADLVAARDPAGLPCDRLEVAERWLAEQVPRWRPQLAALPGFETPAPPRVCRLAWGTPFSELDRGRIHVRALHSVEDRITLAHEYLHLGLRHHPASGDENWVEGWARRLVLGTP